MSKNTLAVVAAIAGILILAGCSSTPTQTTDVKIGSEAHTGQNVSATTPTPTHNPDWGKYTQDEFFIKSMEFGWVHGRPSNETLIRDAHLACSALQAGTARENVTIITGDDDKSKAENKTLLTYAIQVYCPEFTPKV